MQAQVQQTGFAHQRMRKTRAFACNLRDKTLGNTCKNTADPAASAWTTEVCSHDILSTGRTKGHSKASRGTRTDALQRIGYRGRRLSHA